MQNSSSDSIYYHAMLSALSLENNLMDRDPLLFNKQSISSPPFNMFMKRSSLSKAERRAEHNAVERARRENLNGKFQKLAESLPNLQSYRRPSKGQIVEKALDWIRQTIHKENRYRYQIYQLQKENKRLLAQLDIQQDSSTTPPELVDSKSSPPNYQNIQLQYQVQPFQIAQQQSHQNHQTTQEQLQYQQRKHQHENIVYTSMDAPQLTIFPNSSNENSPRSPRFTEDVKCDDQGMVDHQSMSTMLSTATLFPGTYFYNGIPIISSSSASSTSTSTSSMLSTMDPSYWSKIDTLSVPTLVPSANLSF